MSSVIYQRQWLPVFMLLYYLLSIAQSSDSSSAILIQESAADATNQSLFWGTYRPNLYFGTRTRVPESLMSGLMWFGVNDFVGWKEIRYACDQNDGLTEYGYKKHDGRSLAIQTLTDEKNNVTLKTEFIKVRGGVHGGSWGVRISGTPTHDGPSRISVIYHFGLEGDGTIDLVNELDEGGISNPVRLHGDSPDLGKFTISIEDGPNSNIPGNIPDNFTPDLSKTQYWGSLIPEGDIWRAEDYIAGNIMDTVKEKDGVIADIEHTPPSAVLTLQNRVRSDSNFYAFQKFFEAPFQFDIYFNSESAESELNAGTFSEALQSFESSFDDRFEQTFQLQSKGFNADQISFAKAIMSNLLGGIGYFYGSSIVDRAYQEEFENDVGFWIEKRTANPQLTPPSVLFTATPSRPFFPRGFYWDEGFHNMLIGKWDNDLSLDIIKHWVALIDNDGWVAREQILGEEARSKVPPEFQTQYPHYANPPTLLMAIRAFIERMINAKEGNININDVINQEILPSEIISTNDQTIIRDRHLYDRELGELFLRQIYYKLRANYRWFRRTQWGEIKGWGRKAPSHEAYRWRGRTPGHTLTSGLDDYPRPSPPHPAELHVDLICWVGFMARSLRDIAEQLNEEDDYDDFDEEYHNIVENIHALHWSEKYQAFCDLSVDEKGESIHVCHKGYLSLFPMLLEILPSDSPKLGAILDLIHDPNELWSAYGVRSLSKSDKFFNTGEKYWRGPIWININYLALSALHRKYAADPGPYQEKARIIYKELRDIIINNVYKEYKRTGYVWEQYSSSTGRGKRSHPFTGWTSLVTLIMAETY
ncbi:5246_t:CDS:10 [Paraglomus brasilianum]|uniref:Mannosyl-oligosaccharide glucosidase n=1 Tax=Paraglomus brasilianum TaxID=144538 RepID=A0A9N9BYP6_9GLOM|nr:5246_t:CDS:10 [Paraglomus brasilianum]